MHIENLDIAHYLVREYEDIRVLVASLYHKEFGQENAPDFSAGIESIKPLSNPSSSKIVRKAPPRTMENGFEMIESSHAFSESDNNKNPEVQISSSSSSMSSPDQEHEMEGGSQESESKGNDAGGKEALP